MLELQTKHVNLRGGDCQMRTALIASLLVLFVLNMSTPALAAAKKAELHHLQGEVASVTQQPCHLPSRRR